MEPDEDNGELKTAMNTRAIATDQPTPRLPSKIASHLPSIKYQRKQKTACEAFFERLCLISRIDLFNLPKSVGARIHLIELF